MTFLWSLIHLFLIAFFVLTILSRNILPFCTSKMFRFIWWIDKHAHEFLLQLIKHSLCSCLILDFLQEFSELVVIWLIFETVTENLPSELKQILCHAVTHIECSLALAYLLHLAKCSIQIIVVTHIDSWDLPIFEKKDK